MTLDADNKLFFYKHSKAEAIVLDGAKQEGAELPMPTMEYTEAEYGFHIFMDCMEQDRVPETTLEDNYKSYRMVQAGLESVATGLVCRI